MVTQQAYRLLHSTFRWHERNVPWHLCHSLSMHFQFFRTSTISIRICVVCYIDVRNINVRIHNGACSVGSLLETYAWWCSQLAFNCDNSNHDIEMLAVCDCPIGDLVYTDALH